MDRRRPDIFTVRQQKVNADVVVPFKGAPKSPFKGGAILTDAQAADLMAGKYYINIHTAAHKDGEIRGQIEKAATM